MVKSSTGPNLLGSPAQLDGDTEQRAHSLLLPFAGLLPAVYTTTVAAGSTLVAIVFISKSFVR